MEWDDTPTAARDHLYAACERSLQKHLLLLRYTPTFKTLEPAIWAAFVFVSPAHPKIGTRFCAS